MRERLRKAHSNSGPGIFDLKQGTGGIVDIEFLVQYLVLLKSCEYKALLKWTDIVRLLETLNETGVVKDPDAHILKTAYLAYRTAVHRLDLQEKPAKVSETEFHHLREKQSWLHQAQLPYLQLHADPLQKDFLNLGRSIQLSFQHHH